MVCIMRECFSKCKIFLDYGVRLTLLCTHMHYLMEEIAAEIEVLDHLQRSLQQLRTSKNIDIAQAALKRERMVVADRAELKAKLAHESEAGISLPVDRLLDDARKNRGHLPLMGIQVAAEVTEGGRL